MRSTAASAALRSRRESAAEKVVGIEEAEDEIGVRHRRLDAAVAIAGRAGLRRRRSRVRHAARRCGRRARSSRRRRRCWRCPGSAAPRAGRRCAGPTRSPPRRRPPARCRCEVPPMSKGMRSPWLEQPGGVLAAGDAAGRAGEHAARRQPHGLGNGRNAAVRLDDQHRARAAPLRAAAPRGASGSAPAPGRHRR